MQKYHYLPEARCDYIAAIYAEEFGFSGVALLVTLYTMIAAMGFAIAFKTKDIYAGVLPFIGIQLLVLVLVLIMPWLVL